MQGRVAVRHGDGAVVLDPAERVAAVVAALVGYTDESLESARLPVIAGLLAAATLAPLHARAVPERILTQGAPLDEVWHAVRAAVGANPLVDLDIALEQAGAPIPPRPTAMPDLVAAIAAGDLAGSLLVRPGLSGLPCERAVLFPAVALIAVGGGQSVSREIQDFGCRELCSQRGLKPLPQLIHHRHG